MAILRQEDIVNGGEIVIIHGTVDRIIIKEAEQTAKNIEFGVTHIASIVVADQWINYISLGIKEGRDPNIAINTGTKDSPKWVQIQETDEVKVVVKETIKGDKTYYNAKRTGIKLVKKNATPGQAPQQTSSGGSGGGYTAKPRSTEGVSVGHSLNGAMNFLLTQGVETSNENIVKYAKMVHNATEKVKKITEGKNTGMDAYSVGAMSGNAILNACKFVNPDSDFESQLEGIAIDFLDNVVPLIAEHVKGGAKEEAPAARITRATPAKKPATKAPAVAKKEPVMPPLGDSGDFSDMDDQDIPFNDPLKRSGVHLVM